MPTILEISGWRLFFYSNESGEPPHIHSRKAEMECKFWLDAQNYNITEAYSYRLKNKDTREIRKIIFDHFDYILDQWTKFNEER